MDEEELQKRFTDCVYFLASPLTCKKGIECEFRHNEIARLNPRDCWYWLGGCCYNPECAFRHPPLEGLKESYREPLNPNSDPTLPVDRTNIPCYFFSKGFCNKADKCPFLHEPTDYNKPIVKNVAPCEKQLSTENNTKLTPVQTVYPHPNPPKVEKSENTLTMLKHKVENPKLTPVQNVKLVSRSESVESEENVEGEEFVGSEDMVEREEFVESEQNVAESEENVEIVVQSESDVYNDQSSDFDVFVEGEQERLEYEENDVDFFWVKDEEHRERDFHYPQYYPQYDRFNKIDKQSRISIFDRLSFKKRNTHKKLILNVRRGHDLRDRLKKSKVVDLDRRTRRNFRPCSVDFDRRGEVGFDHQGWSKAVLMNRCHPPLKKPRFFSSDGSKLRKPAHQHKRETGVQSAAFTGPKTLDQIKEEKKKAQENVDFGSNNRNGSDGVFQGPRPLSEILKNKRKMGLL